jgi:NTE family protein
MLGVTLENTTTDEFAFQVAGRYLAFDSVGSGSELRIDAAVGAEPQIAAELFRPLGKSPLFVAVAARAERQTFNFIQDNAVIASYNETRTGAAIQGGVDLGRDDEVRLGFIGNYLSASIGTGDPGLPEISGGETRSLLLWIHDGQDSPVVPSSGTRAVGTLGHIFKSPEAPSTIETDRTNTGLDQAEIQSSTFWSWRRRDRLFVVTAAGTSFRGKPLPTEQFQLGRPLRLGAYEIGQFRGDHSLILTGGYLRGVGRLPDFMGGPIYIGGWLENGSVFDRINNSKWRTNASLGAILDTLIGPMILGASFSFDGNQRYYIGIGRIF